MTNEFQPHDLEQYSDNNPLNEPTLPQDGGRFSFLTADGLTVDIETGSDDPDEIFEGGDTLTVTAKTGERVVLNSLLSGTDYSFVFMPMSIQQPGDPEGNVWVAEGDHGKAVVFDEKSIADPAWLSGVMTSIGMARMGNAAEMTQRLTELAQRKAAAVGETEEDQEVMLYGARAQAFQGKVVQMLAEQGISLTDTDTMSYFDVENSMHQAILGPIHVSDITFYREGESYTVSETRIDLRLQESLRKAASLPEVSPVLSFAGSDEEKLTDTFEAPAYLLGSYKTRINNAPTALIALPLTQETNRLEYSVSGTVRGIEGTHAEFGQEITTGHVTFEADQKRPEGMEDGDYVIVAGSILIDVMEMYRLQALDPEKYETFPVESYTLTARDPKTKEPVFTREFSLSA